MTDDRIPDEFYVKAALDRGAYVAESNSAGEKWIAFHQSEENGMTYVSPEDALAAMQRAEPEVTDEMVDAVWQALKGLEGILIAQNIWSVHKDEFCRRIAQAVLDAPATGTNDSAASLGYLAAQALLEKVETHDQR